MRVDMTRLHIDAASQEAVEVQGAAHLEERQGVEGLAEGLAHVHAASHHLN